MGMEPLSALTVGVTSYLRRRRSRYEKIRKKKGE